MKGDGVEGTADGQQPPPGRALYLRGRQQQQFDAASQEEQTHGSAGRLAPLSSRSWVGGPPPGSELVGPPSAVRQPPAMDGGRSWLLGPPGIARTGVPEAPGGGAFLTPPAPPYASILSGDTLQEGVPYLGPPTVSTMGGGSPHRPTMGVGGSPHRESSLGRTIPILPQEASMAQTFRPVLPQDQPPYGTQHPQAPLGSISPYGTSHSTGGRASTRSTPFSPVTQSPHRRPTSAASNASVESQESVGSRGSGTGKKRSKKKGAAKKRSRATPSPQVVQGDGDDPSTPLPQNLRGDPFRSAKVKTELCRNFMSGKGCPFGDKCNYAHGEHELKYTKLLHLENAGLVDVEIFRARPCATWMATGACPFDQRCVGLHDPRVAGSHPSWLPHAETLLNGILSNYNVDRTYHQQLASVYSCSPLYGYIPDRKWKLDKTKNIAAWKHFYAYVCNVTGQPNVGMDPPENYRVAIALKMRENKSAQCYAYKPTHLLRGELCMVIQTKAFLVPLGGNALTSELMEDVTGQQTYVSDPTKMHGKTPITAHEIVFGPAGDPSVRAVSVFFNVSKEDLVDCTQQQAKRHKRSRHRIKKPEDRGKAKTIVTAETCREDRSAAALKKDSSTDLDNCQPFFNYQPIDAATFDLVTDILKHRLRYLDSFAGLSEDADSRRIFFEQLQGIEWHLKARFESQRRHWMTWSWPVLNGVVKIEEDTDVPPVGGTYAFDLKEPDNFQVEAFFGFDDGQGENVISRHETRMAVPYLWESFLINIQLLAGKMPDIKGEKSLLSVDKAYRSLRRLPTLRYLSQGYQFFEDRIIPTFTSMSRSSLQRASSPENSRPSFMDTFFKEWDELLEYYDKTQSSPLRSSQEADAGEKGDDASTETANKIEEVLREASLSEKRISIS